MAPKVDARKKKEAKQKKILLLLAPVLVILMVIQGPKLMSVVGGGGDDTETAAAETAAADTAPASTEPAATTPSDPSTPVDPSASPVDPLDSPAILAESDVPPAADEGQLISFGRFSGKDPFKQLVEAEPPAEPVEAAPAGEDGGKPGDGGEDTDDGKSEPPSVDTAELTVNGAAESVSVGGSFPAADPVFRLVSIDGKVAQIGLVTGTFSTGAGTLDLEVGETLTLVSQPDGVRYKIKLLKVLVGGSE